jgi:hypothetical protein
VYWVHRLALAPVPNWSSRARIVALVIVAPCILASTAFTGLPGMIRGMKKSRLMATIAVAR